MQPEESRARARRAAQVSLSKLSHKPQNSKEGTSTFWEDALPLRKAITAQQFLIMHSDSIKWQRLRTKLPVTAACTSSAAAFPRSARESVHDKTSVQTMRTRPGSPAGDQNRANFRVSHFGRSAGVPNESGQKKFSRACGFTRANVNNAANSGVWEERRTLSQQAA
jgi:hypothetical protein